MDVIIEPLRSLDWNDIDAVEDATGKALSALLGDRPLIRRDVELDEQVNPSSLRALMVRQEVTGNTYALHHTMVHAVVAERYTVSLVIRGPAVKDRFLVMDRATGQSWWQYGAAQETDDEARRKRMRPRRLRELTTMLRQWDLF